MRLKMTSERTYTDVVTNPEQDGFRKWLIDVQRSLQSVFIAHVEAEFYFFLDTVLECGHRRGWQRITPRVSVTARINVVQPVGGPAAVVKVTSGAPCDLETVGIDVVVDG